MPRCKICKQKFEYKWSSFEKTCLEPACILEYKNKVKAKEWKAEKKVLKEKLKTYSDHVKELQVIVNKYVRLRDKDKGCISCGTPLTGKYDAGHYYSCGSYPELRFNEDNIHGQCVHCNQWKHGNLIEYTKRLPLRIGEVKFHSLEVKAHIQQKYSIPELIEMKVIYKDKIKKL
jgi:hypothetical protein